MPPQWISGSGLLGTMVRCRQGWLREPPTIRFVLFGAERCGSALLIDLLKRSAQVQCDRNLLTKPNFFPLWHIQRQALQSGTPVYGFKLSSQDLIKTQRLSEPGRFITLLHEQGYRVIHLRRQNIMRHAVALLKARSEAGIRQRMARQLKRHPIQIQPEALIRTLQSLETQRLEEAAMLVDVPCLRLSYEADLLDSNHHDATARRLCQFLGLDHQPSPKPGLKLVHQQLADLIINYEEIYEALQSSDYAYVLASTPVKLAI
jgi:LPS sulfotransferase NodH